MIRRVAVPRSGGALLLVLLLVFLLLTGIFGAYLRTSIERRVAMDASAQVDAFAIAESGVDHYLATVTSLPAVLPDLQTYALAGGTAVVTLRALRLAPSDTTLVLISRGTSTTSRYAPNATAATRTVTQLVRWGGASIVFPGAFVSLVPVHKNGASGSLSGVDACSVPPAPLPSIPGVAVPSVSASDTTPAYSGSESPIAGSSGSAPVPIGTPGPNGTAAASLPIDWAGIVARTAITPTYYYRTTVPTSGGWPTSAQLGGSHWPVTFVEGDLNLPSDGQGILIVTGNMTVHGNAQWDGLVLVGGTITSNGNNRFFGAMVAGLNVKLGRAVDAESVDNGNKTFQYNSCDVANALRRPCRLAAYPQRPLRQLPDVLSARRRAGVTAGRAVTPAPPSSASPCRGHPATCRFALSPGTPMNTRRQFLIKAPIALLAATGACRIERRPPAPAARWVATPRPARRPPSAPRRGRVRR